MSSYYTLRIHLDDKLIIKTHLAPSNFTLIQPKSAASFFLPSQAANPEEGEAPKGPNPVQGIIGGVVDFFQGMSKL